MHPLISKLILLHFVLVMALSVIYTCIWDTVPNKHKFTFTHHAVRAITETNASLAFGIVLNNCHKAALYF